MEFETPVAETPTAKPQGVTPTEQKPSEVEKSLSLGEKLEQSREKFKKLNEAPKAEEKPIGEKVGEAEVEPKETTEQPATDSVIVDGKEIPKDDFLTENLKSAEFEVFVGDKAHPVKGIDELLKFASMGINSTEKNALAKQAVMEAQKAIAESQASAKQEAQKLADDMLTKLVDQVSRGIDPGTGQPFASAEHKAGAEDLTARLLEAKRSLPQPDNSELESVRNEIKALKQQLTEKEQGSQRAQADQQAQAILEKVKSPFTQDPIFQKADGKINVRLFNQFGEAVEKEAISQATKMGRRLTITEAENLIKSAAKTVYADYKETLDGYAERKIEGKVKQKPVPPIKTGGELSRSVLNKAPQGPAKNMDAEIKRRLAEARAAGKIS